MTTSPNLSLSYIALSQAQKEITHNAALNDLDFLAQASVLDHTLATPPASPNTGDSYIFAASPSGVWTGFANGIAGYYGGWSIKIPQAGWVAWTRNGNRLLYFTGMAWALLDTPKLDGTATWNPGSIANKTGVTSSALSISGAALGDVAAVAAPYDLQGIQATAYVNAANSALIRLTNMTGAAVTLSSGTWRVRVSKS